MTQSLFSERKLSLNELAQREGINISTAWRWTLRGVRGVRLATFSAGGRRYTTEEAYCRFCEAITAITVGSEQPPSQCRTNRSSQSAFEAAESSLIEAGG